MTENWKPLMYGELDLTEIFEVSDLGNIRRIGSDRLLKQTVNHEGYKGICVSLGSRKNRKMIKVHRAVAFMFVDGYKKGLVVNHKDLNKTNNNATNLEWVTDMDNRKHAYENKEWSARPKKVICKQTGEIFNSISDALKWCNLKTNRGITLCAQGKRAYSGKHPITKERLSWEYA